MQTASRLISDVRFRTPATDVESSLVTVAKTFVQLQQKRHDCDYDLSFNLSPVEALGLVKLATAAFTKWETIRTEQIAGDYLYSLLFKEHRR